MKSKLWQSRWILVATLLLNAAWQTFAILYTLPQRLRDIGSEPAAMREDSTHLVVFFGSEVFSILAYWASVVFVWLVSSRLGKRLVAVEGTIPVPSLV